MRLPRLVLSLAPLLVLSLSLAPAGCSKEAPSGAPGTARPASRRVKGAEARRLVREGAVLLDVRTPEEFEDAHVEGARNLPLDRLMSAMGALPRDRPLVVYCAVGSRSSVAVRILAASGYDARDLGPMAAWSR